MYSIGQIEELTGVKAHILRYWEEVIPGFAPQKDVGGRRIYTQRELELVLRLKYLIYEKKYTIEGARDQLIYDADS
ncbi:MAG: MerR family transcriptional regulator, partial [Treponema sp.]|nr:MerR family transcriptional regulator [Treponema sp.]